MKLASLYLSKAQIEFVGFFLKNSIDEKIILLPFPKTLFEISFAQGPKDSYRPPLR